MTCSVNSQYSSQALESTLKNCDVLVDFLIDSEGKGKYNMPLSRVQGLFDRTWKNLPTASGHIKKQHRITGAVVVYKNHDNSPVDPGAIVSIREALQTHINYFYEKFLGFSTRQKRQIVPNFLQIAERLNQKGGPL